MIHLGRVRPGRTIYIPFESFASSTGAPITLTGLATSDIKVYKDGSTTERASTSGYTLLDTDGIDFDGLTGIHGFSIDLSDNTTAGFWAAGSRYIVVVDAVTVDSQTMRFIAAVFTIGVEGSVLDTTIATLSSQTSFTLTNGPAEDDALNGMWCIIHDVASAVQWGKAVILDYTGATKTVTLAAGVTFTAAATDNFSLMGLAPLQPTTTGRTLDVSSGGEAGVDWANVGSPTTSNALTNTSIASVSGAVGSVTGAVGSVTGAVGSVGVGGISSGSFASGAITAGVIAADAIGASELAADAIAEIADAVWDEDATAHQTAGTFGLAIGDPGASAQTLHGVVTSNIDAAISTRATPAQVNAEADTALADVGLTTTITGRIDAAVSTRASQTSLDTVDDFIDTEIATLVTATSAASIRTAVGLTAANLDTQLGDLPTANENADAVLDRADAIETGWTLRKALRIIAAGICGKLSGAATSTVTIRNVIDSKDRITATVDANGNRLAVTLDGT